MQFEKLFHLLNLYRFFLSSDEQLSTIFSEIPTISMNNIQLWINLFELFGPTVQIPLRNRCKTTSTGKPHRSFASCSIKEVNRSLVNSLHVSRISKCQQEQNWACWENAYMLGICVSLMNRWAETRQTTPGISTLLKAFCYFVVLSMRFNVIDVRPTILFSSRFFFIFVILSCVVLPFSCISPSPSSAR